MQTQAGPKGDGFTITDDTGRSHYRRMRERDDDSFIMVECDQGHVYAVGREDFRAGDGDCPCCEAV